MLPPLGAGAGKAYGNGQLSRWRRIVLCPNSRQPVLGRRKLTLNATICRSVINVASICGLYLAAAMLVPAFTDLYFRHDEWRVFALSVY